LTSLQVKVQVDQVVAKFNVIQTYKNTLDSQIECAMIIPKIEGYVMGKLLIKVGDADVIEGKVFKKEKAEQKYEDAIAKGDTAVMAKESKQGHIKI
jgi:hypothetical protein